MSLECWYTAGRMNVSLPPVFSKRIATMEVVSWCGRRSQVIAKQNSCMSRQFDGCKEKRRNPPTSSHARIWPTEGVIPTGQWYAMRVQQRTTLSRITSMSYHGLPNRRIWIRLNTFGTIWINVCASVNLHLRPSINSVKCYNRIGEQYHEIMLENWLSLCRGCVEQCGRAWWSYTVLILT